jgi:PAS domain S-box-containing protein
LPTPTARDYSPIRQRLADISARLSAHESPLAEASTLIGRLSDTVPMSDRRKRAEEQPTERYIIPECPDRFLLADVMAAIPHPVVVLNPQGHVIFWSDAAAETFGWTSAEVVGRPPAFLPADRFSEHARHVTQATQGVPVRDAVTERRDRDGKAVPVLVSMSPDAGGNVVSVYQTTPGEIPMAVPVEEPPKRPDHARQLEALGRVAANVVHDLNNLLAVVGGYADLLHEWLPPKTFGRQYSDVIRAAVRHASALTHRALNFAKPDDPRPTAFDLGTLLADLAPLIRASAGSRVECVLTPEVDVPNVWADRGQIEQVVLNLVANARDAMPRGGVLGVRTSVATVRPGQPGWPADRLCGRYVCLSVADNGTGIDDPTLARVFDPFFTTKGTVGTGLGLATIRDIVNGCHGHIEVDSKPDTGTVFRVYFPAAQETADDPDPFVDLPASHDGETALLVEDDDALRGLAKAALESVGYNVIEARTGDDAAKLARVVQEPIDLLVTDVVMPGLTGRRLAERMRCTRPGLPVVFVSGYPTTGQELEPGMRFVRKPFLAEHLLTAVQKVTQVVATA